MLDSDRLLDRRRLKRQLIVWRTLAIIFVGFLVLVAIGRFGLGVGGRSHFGKGLMGLGLGSFKCAAACWTKSSFFRCMFGEL